MNKQPKQIYIAINCILHYAFHLCFTAAAVYRIQIAELEPYQLILVGTALEVGILLFETPTGVVADLKSRKLSVLIGLAIIGLGFALEASFTFFFTIAIAQVVWGLGYTFISGALSAWISDESKDIELESILLSGAQYSRFFSLLGIGTAIALGTVSIRAAMYLAAGILIFLSFIMIKLMPEKHFQPTPHTGSVWHQYTKQLTAGLKHIRGNRILIVLLVIIFCYGLYSEGIDRLYELYILEHLDVDAILQVPSIWVIGGLNAIVSIGGILMLGIVKRHLSVGVKTVVWVMLLTAMMMAGVLTFAYNPSVFWAVSGFVIFQITREGTYPLLEAIQLRNTPSDIKATVLSSFSQMDAIGQLMSGPLMVAVAALVGIQATFAFSSMLLGLALVFLLILKRRISHSKAEGKQ